jgi:hypothetical protein
MLACSDYLDCRRSPDFRSRVLMRYPIPSRANLEKQGQAAAEQYPEWQENLFHMREVAQWIPIRWLKSIAPSTS